MGSLVRLAPAGRYVYSKHSKTNPKAPEGRHVCSVDAQPIGKIA